MAIITRPRHVNNRIGIMLLQPVAAKALIEKGAFPEMLDSVKDGPVDEHCNLQSLLCNVQK